MAANLLYAREISFCDYNEKDSVLTIHFKSGICKKYLDVPRLVYESLMKAYDQNGFYRTEIDGLFCVR